MKTFFLKSLIIGALVATLGFASCSSKATDYSVAYDFNGGGGPVPTDTQKYSITDTVKIKTSPIPATFPTNKTKFIGYAFDRTATVTADFSYDSTTAKFVKTEFVFSVGSLAQNLAGLGKTQVILYAIYQ